MLGFWADNKVYIYFHKIRPIALRLQTKDAHTVDEAYPVDVSPPPR